MDSEWITTESGTTVLGFEYGLRLAVSSPLYHGLYHKGFLFRPAQGRMSEERLWWSGSLCCGRVRVRTAGLRKRPPWYPFFCFSLCLPGSPQPHLIGLVGPHFMNRTPYVNFLDVRHNSRFKKKKKSLSSSSWYPLCGLLEQLFHFWEVSMQKGGNLTPQECRPCLLAREVVQAMTS